MATKRIKPKRVGTKVIIPCRLSYVHLDAPWSGSEQNEKKYSVSCIIPKDDKETVDVINAAIAEAKQAGKTSKWGGKIPGNLKIALHDGSERDDEAYEDSVFFGASSKQPVPTLNRLQEAIPPTDVYSGCYAMVSVTFFPYDTGSKGIGAGLNAVLKTDEGERLGGGGDASKDFDGMDLGVEDSLDDL